MIVDSSLQSYFKKFEDSCYKLTFTSLSEIPRCDMFRLRYHQHILYLLFLHVWLFKVTMQSEDASHCRSRWHESRLYFVLWLWRYIQDKFNGGDGKCGTTKALWDGVLLSKHKQVSHTLFCHFCQLKTSTTWKHVTLLGSLLKWVNMLVKHQV